MLTLRFSRTGKRQQAYFRLIVLDKAKDPWGTFLENLGNYNPRSKKLEINAERVKFWLSKGAIPSATVHNLLISQKIIEGKKTRVSRLSKKRKDRLAEKAKTEKPTAPAEKPAEPIKEEAKLVEVAGEAPKVEEAKAE